MSDPRNNPDPLGQAVDRVVDVIRQLLPTERQALADVLGVALGDLFAELIGRATSMSASIIAPTLRKVEDFEKRERARYERLRDLEATVNGRVDKLYGEQLTPEERAHHIGRIDRLEQEIETLKQKQVGDDDGAERS